MKFDISQRFHFESAHTLARDVDAESSRRVHGHTYHAEVTITGQPAADTGMVVDLGVLRQALDQVRHSLDHRLLDDVAGLGPPTLENLCSYIARQLAGGRLPVSHVRVWRAASGDSCLLTLDATPGLSAAHPVEHEVDERRADDPQRKQG